MTCGAEAFTTVIEKLRVHQTGSVKQQEDQMRTYRASEKLEATTTKIGARHRTFRSTGNLSGKMFDAKSTNDSS